MRPQLKEISKYSIWLPMLLAQVLFLAAAWPFLSGESVFAPRAYVAERAFRGDGLLDREITPRDRFGADDFLDQERIFLRFYRDSVRSGHLPFWNEGTFGGVSQEDSMIYSYLSPLNFPWLFIKNDHIAKGVQIFLLLNLGAFAIFWWCRILNIGPAWTLASIILATITPLALHFQAHTHQPALYYTGLLLLAAFHNLIQEGKRSQLWIFFLLTCLAVVFNFLSVLLFICIGLAVLAVAHFISMPGDRVVVVRRILIAASTFLLALLTLSFFLGPIFLESHLVREPVTPVYRSFAPWSGWSMLVDSVSFFRFGDGVWIPLVLVIPVIVMFRFGRRHVSARMPSAVVGFLALLVFATLVSCVPPFIKLFRLYFPGMEYSTNGVFRLLFFANLCAVPALAWLFENADRKNFRLNVSVTLAMLFILGINVLQFAVATQPAWWTSWHPKLLQMSELLASRGLVESAGFASAISLAFLGLWFATKFQKTAVSVFLAFVIGLGFIGIYHYQRPNLQAALDPAHHPIFEAIPKGSSVVTLEDCTAPSRSGYRSETTMAGMRSYDAPTDVGLFPQIRRFWAYWNDVDEFNRRGANLMEVLWICSERAIDQTGSINPAFAALARVVGIEYIFTDRVIFGSNVTEIGSVGRLRAYRVANAWPDTSFLPDTTYAEFEALIGSLAVGKTDRLKDLVLLEQKRIAIPGTRLGTLSWDVRVPESARNRHGVLFMNHLLEYHRGFVAPFLHLPLEGRWVLRQGDSVMAFPLSPVPFRMIETELNTHALNINYSLTHYYLWFGLSIAGLIGFLLLWLKSGRVLCDEPSSATQEAGKLMSEAPK